MRKVVGMKWLDTHVHISGASPDGTFRKTLTADLLAIMKATGADTRFVVSCGEMGVELRGMIERPEGLLEASQFIHGIVQQAPDRLYGACTVNPHFLSESLATMDICFGQYGFVMLGEMLQYAMHYRMNSAPVEQLVRKAVEFGIPVQVHISTSNSAQGPFASGEEELLDLLSLVERGPEANYILAHLVGTPKADQPVVETYLNIIEDRLGKWPRNFWAEIRDFNSPGVATALERIPHDRLVAGTDWCSGAGPPYLPYGVVFGAKSAEENPYHPDVPTLVGFLMAAGASLETVRAIAFENAVRLLKLV